MTDDMDRVLEPFWEKEAEWEAEVENAKINPPDYGTLMEWYESRMYGLEDVRNSMYEQIEKDREALWKIWDILQLWRVDDHQWSSDEIEWVADAMLKWVPNKWMLPPEESRMNRAESYEPEIVGPPEDE